MIPPATSNLGRALLVLGHGAATVRRDDKFVVLLKSSDEGKISRGGKARLGVDSRGRKHWVTDQADPKESQSAGGRHPAATSADTRIEGARKAFARIGVDVTEEEAENSGRTYIGFAGNTYAQLAQFRALKDQGLCWGFRKGGKFLWACKPENLQRVTEVFHGSAATGGQQPGAGAGDAGEKEAHPPDRATEAGPGSAEPRSDRRGDDRGGARPEPGGAERVPEGEEARGEGRDSDDRGAPEDGAGAQRDTRDVEGSVKEVGDTEKPTQKPNDVGARLRELMTGTAPIGKWDVSEQNVLKFTPHTPGSHSPEVKKFIEAVEQSGLEVWHSAHTKGAFEVRKPGTQSGVVDRRGREVTGPDKKIKSMAEIQGDSAAREAARPKEFGKYGQEGGIRHWQVSEDDYVDAAWERSIERAESNAKSWRRVADDQGQRPKARAEAKGHAESWGRILADKKAQKGPTERERQFYRDEYMKLVRKAISEGELVPTPVVNQRPEFQKARDARERYDKGRHTSYANKSIAVGNDLVESHGVKIKRQDGKAITEAQTREIADGIREIESVLGPIGDLLRKADVTISHTNGKMPFLMKAGGVFHAGENTVTVGIEGVQAMAHELAHFLDYEAGRRRGKSTYVYRGGRSGGFQSPSMAAAHSDAELMRQAARSMNDSYKAERIAKIQPGRINASDEEKEEIKLIKVQLGSYWRRPEEIFARLVEQHIATEREAAEAAGERDGSTAGVHVRIREASRHASHERARSYENMPGWWDRETFAALQPMVRRAIADRLEALGADPTQVLKGGAKPMTKAGPLSRMRYWFRSLLGRREDILDLTDVVEEPRPPCCAQEPRVVVLMRTR